MKWALFIIIIAAIVAIAIYFGSPANQTATKSGEAITKAKELYQEKKAAGTDFSSGPCLGEIMSGWVADIAHQPRAAVDDDPANQCEAYRSGKAAHFVELDPEGNLIRAQ